MSYDNYIARDPRDSDPDAVREPEPEPVPICQRCGGDQDVIAGLCDVCADTVGKRTVARRHALIFLSGVGYGALCVIALGWRWL